MFLSEFIANMYNENATKVMFNKNFSALLVNEKHIIIQHELN